MRVDAPGPRAASNDLAVAFMIGVLLLATLFLYGTIELGSFFARGRWEPGNPVSVVSNLLRGREGHEWTAGHTVAAVLVGGLFVAAAAVVVRALRRRNKSRSEVDRKARYLGSPAPLSREVAEQKQARGSLTTAEIPPGLRYGTATVDGTDLYLDWRGTIYLEAGTGWGKTLAAIAMCLDAPGVLLCTSNKRDLADGIRLARERVGTFWCFDAQRIADYHAGGPPPFWWNILRDVKGPVEAKSLADIFVDATTPPDSNKHPYFDTRGPMLLANLLLAAAVAGHQIPKVYEWLSDPEERAPIRILEKTGHRMSAFALKGAYSAEPGERSGLFGTAANAVDFLTDPALLEWVTDDGTRPEFRPDDFVRSGRDTLMSISREGDGTAGPLTTALTVAVTRAAERYARTRGGRMPVPLVAVLDEVANVCRWKQLPDQFSYFGSTGITLVAIFQNWAQGVLAYRADGMQKLFNGATARIIGGGLADRAHLSDISQLCGERRIQRRTANLDQMGLATGSGYMPEREAILDVDDLMALDPGRFVVLPSAGYAVMGDTVPFTARPDLKPVVDASFDRYKPRDGTPAAVDGTAA